MIFLLIADFFKAGKCYEDEIKNILSKIKENTVTEIMFHPGECDDELRNISSLAIEREKELQALLNVELESWLKSNNFELVDFSLSHKTKR